jgi:hypothetical protein
MVEYGESANNVASEPTPVFLFAHGSTMMLGEESEPARIWENIGNECLRRGVKRIVMMVRRNKRSQDDSESVFTQTHRALIGTLPTIPFVSA